MTIRQREELEQESSHLHGQLAELEQQLSVSRGYIRDKEDENTLLRQQIEGRNAATKEMMQNSVHQEKQLHTAQEELKKAQTDIQHLTSEVEELNKKCTELQGTVHILKVTCDEHEATEKQLNAQLNTHQLQDISTPSIAFTG